MEPVHYWFCFEPKNGVCSFRVEREEKWQASIKTLEYEAEGDLCAIVFPFYDAVKEFLSFDYQEPHWPVINQKVVDNLDKMIKARKPEHDESK